MSDENPFLVTPEHLIDIGIAHNNILLLKKVEYEYGTDTRIINNIIISSVIMT